MDISLSTLFVNSEGTAIINTSDLLHTSFISLLACIFLTSSSTELK